MVYKLTCLSDAVKSQKAIVPWDGKANCWLTTALQVFKTCSEHNDQIVQQLVDDATSRPIGEYLMQPTKEKLKQAYTFYLHARQALDHADCRYRDANILFDARSITRQPLFARMLIKAKGKEADPYHHIIYTEEHSGKDPMNVFFDKYDINNENHDER